jgi:hypothetical protein
MLPSSRTRKVILWAGLVIALLAAALIIYALLPVQDQLLQVPLSPTLFALPPTR